MMLVTTKIYSYTRNVLYRWLFAWKQHTLLRRKILNVQNFKTASKDSSDTLHTINFVEGYSIITRGRDLHGVVEVCIFEDYTRSFDIKPGMTIYDLGSCIGDFAILAAHRGARVVAVEPDPQNYEILVKNIQRNNLGDKIIPLNIAIDTTSGWTGLDNSSTNTGGYTLSEHAPTRVPTRTIAQIMEAHNHQFIHLLKIDVEGSEYKIFQDRQSSSLNRIGTIIGEYHLDIQKPEYSWKALKRLLAKDFIRMRNYAPYYFEASKN
jgi:FkbM family methyltransferase